ncbi:hypothetical protein I4F81_011587 [Pyropia yezoensis]|uniref:Uncharacterized protein n=1 Tax=Pyropia yezoensis TaxID=2788 RepID=A0ACC3CGP1_PYRYE|nr:hypothetical protein I4F81_011587 [Neopyropia yezoensis]
MTTDRRSRWGSLRPSPGTRRARQLCGHAPQRYGGAWDGHGLGGGGRDEMERLWARACPGWVGQRWKPSAVTAVGTVPVASQQSRGAPACRRGRAVPPSGGRGPVSAAAGQTAAAAGFPGKGHWRVAGTAAEAVPLPRRRG